ncbi:unnamed protein product [Arabidopsis halleri]
MTQISHCITLCKFGRSELIQANEHKLVAKLVHPRPEQCSSFSLVSIGAKSDLLVNSLSFKLPSPKSNSIAKDIAHSVTTEGHITSYLAIEGPSWLHSRIEDGKRN